MRYKIESIEGIGPTYGAALSAVGISDTTTLLQRCGSRPGREEVASATGLKKSQLLKWANMADLMRISGVGEEYSELLEAAGVDTVKELRNRNADNLASKMKLVNSERKLTRTVPAATRVASWIDQARKLEPAISH